MIGRERELIILRRPALCWWREAVIDAPMDVHPLCWQPWSEVCAYTIGVGPGVDANNNDNPSTHVLRLYWLDHRSDVPEGAFPISAEGVPDAKMIGATYAKERSIHPMGRGGWAGIYDHVRECAWSRLFQQFWRTKALIESGSGLRCPSALDYILSQESHIVPVVDCFRSLPWAMESTARAHDYHRESWGPEKIIVAYSAGSTHSRVWYVPPRAADLPAPKGAIDPASIAAGKPTRPARKRWLPVPKHVRLSV